MGRLVSIVYCTFWQVCQWESFTNKSIFGEVVVSQISVFLWFTHSVYIVYTILASVIEIGVA